MKLDSAVTMRTLLVVLICFVAIAALLPPVAFAQEQEAPLRLVYINTAESSGQPSFGSVEQILDGTEQIDLMSPRQFWRHAEAANFDIDSFRQSDQREDNIEGFAALMRTAELEGILVHDVFGRGNTMQVVVLGPQGWELDDIRHSIPRGRIDEQGSVEVLRQVFTSLVPEVRGFRRQQEEERLNQEETAEVPVVASPSEPTPDPREVAMANHREKYGNLTRNISAQVGPLMGHRAMRFTSSESGFALDHITPLFGVALRADALITTLDRGTAALELGGFLGFAPFTTVFAGNQLEGQYFKAGADFRYINARSASLRFRAIAGIETLNLSLTPNEQYTGHGYLIARAGAGIHYSFGSLMTMQLDALLLPILVASNSGGAYGEPEGWLGYGAELGIDLDLIEPILASIHYGFQRFELDHPNPPIIEAPAASRDMIHQFMISAGYRF
jgi:hypothetical protein